MINWIHCKYETLPCSLNSGDSKSICPLQLIVAGFSSRADLNKAGEIANEVRRLMKDLKECQQQAAVCNQRERLFNLPVTQVS